VPVVKPGDQGRPRLSFGITVTLARVHDDATLDEQSFWWGRAA